MTNKYSNLKDKTLISEKNLGLITSSKINKNITSQMQILNRNSELPLSSSDLKLALNKSLNPSDISAKEFPNASKQWINSVYSFNSNYIKNIPSADNILNKIIKSFFNLNPLANNVTGKKSKLTKRRFRRLSLNKMFLSKSEIKHSNDKVHVTVYLFNKKKRSLIYKINKLFSAIRFKPLNVKQNFLFRNKRRSKISKYFNSKSLNPSANNKGKWIKSKKILFILNKFNTINKKYNGSLLYYYKSMQKKYLALASKNKSLSYNKYPNIVSSNSIKLINYLKSLNKKIFIKKKKALFLKYNNSRENIRKELLRLHCSINKPKLLKYLSIMEKTPFELISENSKKFSFITLLNLVINYKKIQDKKWLSEEWSLYLNLSEVKRKYLELKKPLNLKHPSKKNTISSIFKSIKLRKHGVKPLKRKVLFKSYKKLYKFLGLYTKKRIHFKKWRKNNKALSAKIFLALEAKNRNSKYLTKNKSQAELLAKKKRNKNQANLLSGFTSKNNENKVLASKRNSACVKPLSGLNPSLINKKSQKLNPRFKPGYYRLHIKSLNTEIAKKFKPNYYNLHIKSLNTEKAKNLNPESRPKLQRLNGKLFKTQNVKPLYYKLSSGLYRLNVKPLNSTTLKTVKLTRKYLNLRRKAQVMPNKLCIYNISKINSNYIKSLEIKKIKSCLKTVKRKTRSLTLNKFKTHFFKRRFIKRSVFYNELSKKKILNYVTLNNVTKNMIYKFSCNLLKAHEIYQKKALKPVNLPLNTAGFKVKALGKYANLALVKSYYNKFNKYKLYKLSVLEKKPRNLNQKKNLFNKTFKISLNRHYLLKTNYMPSLSMHKLKELYKLFTFYNNKTNIQERHNITLASNDLRNKSLNQTNSIKVLCNNPSLNLNAMSSKLLINTYKLLKKSFAKFETWTEKSILLHKKALRKHNGTMKSLNFASNDTKLALIQPLNVNNKYLKLIRKYKLFNQNNYIKSRKNLKQLIRDKRLHNTGKTVKNLYLKTIFTNKRFKRKIKNNAKNIRNILRTRNNVNILHYFNKIDRFFTKYSRKYLPKGLVYINNDNVENKACLQKPFVSALSDGKLSKPELALAISNSQIRSIYKLNFLKLLFEDESIYLNYIKLLSFNNAIFKNWFLHSLKNTISKIYNKNVILNIVNLKYIHLNSDILVNAIKVKLNKYRKNRVRKILKLIINKIKISRVNKEFFNLNSEKYKNVLRHFNNYNTLNNEVFNHLNINIHSKNENYKTLKKANGLKKKFNYYKIPSKLKALSAIQYNTINLTKYKYVTGVRVQAQGRLTKRSTAARSVLSLRYAGSLRNNNLISNNTSSILLKNNKISNLQFTKITSKTRNGSFGVKGWISSN